MKNVPHAKITAGPEPIVSPPPLIAPAPSTRKTTQPIGAVKKDHIPGHPKPNNKSHRKKPVVVEEEEDHRKESTRTEKRVVARSYPTHNPFVPPFKPSPPIAKKDVSPKSKPKSKPKKGKKIAPKVEKTLFESKGMGQAQKNHLAAASYQHGKLKNKGHREGKSNGMKSEQGNGE